MGIRRRTLAASTVRPGLLARDFDIGCKAKVHLDLIDKTHFYQPRPQALMSVVIPPGIIFFGSCSSASSSQFLTSNSITHVLSIGEAPYRRIEGVTYHWLSLDDSIGALIGPTVRSAIEIIKFALSSNDGQGRIFVHCAAGVSRSPTIVVAYLMVVHSMPLRQALGLVIRARPQVLPNLGFIAQLKRLELELFGFSTLHVDALPRREDDRLELFSAHQS